MPSATPKPLVFIVVGTLSFLSISGVLILGLALFYRGYRADPVIMTSLIQITTGSISALTAILVNTRQPTVNGSTTTTTTTTSPKKGTTDDPTPVVIQQPTDAPVPVTETTKP